MKLSLVLDNSSETFPIVSVDGNVWYRFSDIVPELDTASIIDILAIEKQTPGLLFNCIEKNKSTSTPVHMSSVTAVLPFQPRSYRDFMLYETHAINAARGFVKKYLPKLLPVVTTYEKTFSNPFPKLKPHKRYYEYPIYYLGNHLNFVTHGSKISIPQYTQELDYELELGIVICKPLKNASPQEALDAIGGFTVFNDFSARDVQMSEIRCGFGPMKAKNFINAISTTVVTPDEILPMIDQLKVNVSINNEKIAENTTAGMYYTIGEAIAYASWEEQLYPGEFFGSGTVPDCTGIENGHFLKSGDTIQLEIEKIGVLENIVE